ncbi:hypothetical protein PGT21_036325 [Puccinia graminis f. sp. tritici]|uniref:Uncharacterized protein n=1 Tax=Puccinia graminis f. sp. tritici TaxID=56615 RepID=A0A5B0QQK4_PUCGR|nr:hypothetical protein PGT21_036325 [Puccinia graminis f. sp. tritici]
MIDSEILEYLIGLFSYTIVMLHQLKCVDYFSLYIQDIQDIGRIENLRDLHLDISATPSGEHICRYVTNPVIFSDLMVATRGLKSLNLDIHISLTEVPDPGLWKTGDIRQSLIYA